MTKNDLPFWMPQLDRKGRPIPQGLVDAAHRVWPHVLYLAQRELKDTSRAAEILEWAVCRVSNIIHRKGPDNHILDQDSYLYWTAARILYRAIEKDKMIQFIDEVEPVAIPKVGSYRNSPTKTEKKILLRQVIRYMDSRTRRMFLLRVQGYSWRQIGKDLGITAENAAVVFNTGLDRARQRIFGGLTSKSKSAVG